MFVLRLEMGSGGVEDGVRGLLLGFFQEKLAWQNSSCSWNGSMGLGLSEREEEAEESSIGV